MAGMNLFDMIVQAQGGKVARSAGKQFGLNAQQSRSAIAALLPAVSSALKQNSASPQGMAGLLGALQGNDHGRYMDNPDVYSHSATRNEGNAILGHLFGSKDVSRAVTGHAAKQSGIGADVLKKMLPMVATMAMGSLSKQTREPSMASQLAGLALGGGQQSGGLGSLLGALTGGNARRQRGYQQQQQQGMGILGKLLDADSDGNMMDDVLGMAMKQMMKR